MRAENSTIGGITFNRENYSDKQL